MATVSKWTPFGVALDISATINSVTRVSASQFSVNITASWETYYAGAKTNYGMEAKAGIVTAAVSAFDGTKRSSGSKTFTANISISGNGSATKTVTVTFRNFNTDNGDSATKDVNVSVNVPAWTSYTVSYNAAGGTGAPSKQTKWKDQALTLSSTKPTLTGYTFNKWNTSSTGNGTSYASGASYTENASATLYALWTAKTYKITFNANGGTGAPSQQTKTHNVNLTLSSTKPVRAGYTFAGWATTASATTATYPAGGTFTTNAATTLYAVWSTSYVKPKISNVSIVRNGNYVNITFSWKTSQAVSSVVIEHETNGNVNRETISASGTEATTTTSRYADPNLTHTFRIIVSDGGGSWTVSRVLSGATYPFGMIPENKGCSVGKKPELEGYFDVGYKTRNRDRIEFENCVSIYGITPDGDVKEALNPSNENGNVVLGWDNYDKKSGNTNVYGFDLNLGVSNIANPGTYRPYKRRGESQSLSIRTSGYITNAKQDLSFWIPFSVPIIGSPTVTITCGNGFQLRQGDKYICGSSASAYATPTTIEATATMFNGIYVKAVFSDTTNVTNNDTVGIYFNGTITFT